MYAGVIVHVVGTAVCQMQKRRLRSVCGRRNGITSLSSLLICIVIS